MMKNHQSIQEIIFVYGSKEDIEKEIEELQIEEKPAYMVIFPSKNL
jgi:hypothetical protein